MDPNKPRSGTKPIAKLLLVFIIFLICVVGILVYTGSNLNCTANYEENVEYSNELMLLNECLEILAEQDKCNYEDYVLGQPVQQTDPCLISTFKKKLLIAPPPFEEINREPVNVSKEIPSNIEKFNWIEKLLIQKDNPPKGIPGFYIECGANDGSFNSATIRIEKIYHWNGLLIEANPIPFQKLLKKGRNAWAVNAALCIRPYPEQVTFYTNPKHTPISGLRENEKKGVDVNITVSCIPLFTMLAALNVTTVDFFNLDIEGAELSVLKTIPFDKLTFKVLSIEYKHIPEGKKALIEFMGKNKYRFVKTIHDSKTQDCLFVHESLYDLANTIKNKEDFGN